LDETILSEQRMSRGEAVTRPFVIVAQPSLIDATRAPAGRHTLWAYCHVPARSERDMTAVIESQIERFAPGFGNQIEARHVYGPAAIEAYNPNYVGGDIAGGAHSGVQLLFRPTRSLRFYRTPAEDIFLCSASTPPGAGVHGMCGYLAAQAALRTTLSH
jgi:phytoene dehydrogenase-like protein